MLKLKARVRRAGHFQPEIRRVAIDDAERRQHSRRGHRRAARPRHAHPVIARQHFTRVVHRERCAGRARNHEVFPQPLKTERPRADHARKIERERRAAPRRDHLMHQRAGLQPRVNHRRHRDRDRRISAEHRALGITYAYVVIPRVGLAQQNQLPVIHQFLDQSRQCPRAVVQLHREQKRAIPENRTHINDPRRLLVLREKTRRPRRDERGLVLRDLEQIVIAHIVFPNARVRRVVAGVFLQQQISIGIEREIVEHVITPVAIEQHVDRAARLGIRDVDETQPPQSAGIRERRRGDKIKIARIARIPSAILGPLEKRDVIVHRQALQFRPGARRDVAQVHERKRARARRRVVRLDRHARHHDAVKRATHQARPRDLAARRGLRAHVDINLPAGIGVIGQRDDRFVLRIRIGQHVFVREFPEVRQLVAVARRRARHDVREGPSIRGNLLAIEKNFVRRAETRRRIEQRRGQRQIRRTKPAEARARSDDVPLLRGIPEENIRDQIARIQNRERALAQHESRDERAIHTVPPRQSGLRGDLVIHEHRERAVAIVESAKPVGDSRETIRRHAVRFRIHRVARGEQRLHRVPRRQRLHERQHRRARPHKIRARIARRVSD